MKPRDWEKAVARSADPQRAKYFLPLFNETEAKTRLKNFTADQAGLFLNLLSGSETLSETLLNNIDWLEIFDDIESLKRPRREQGFKREFKTLVELSLEQKNYSAAFSQVRLFKQ